MATLGGLPQAAQTVAAHGRYGDTRLVHMSNDEISVMEHLAGHPLTVNPVTGLPEAFSLWKLLAGVGIGIAGAFTGGLAIPFLGTLAASTVPAGLTAGLLGTAGALVGSSFAPSGDPQADAQKAIDARTAQDQKGMYKFGVQSVPLYASSHPPSITGQEQSYFVPGIKSATANTQGAADGGSLAPKLEPEQVKTNRVRMAAIEAIIGRGKDPAKALNEFIAMFGRAELIKLEQQVRQAQQPTPPPQAGGLAPSPTQPPASSSMAGGPPPMPPQEPPGSPQPPGMAHGGLMAAKTASGVPLKASNGSFVVTADNVANAGDGSSKAGAQRFDAMMDRIPTPGKKKGHTGYDSGGLVHGPGGGLDDMAPTATDSGQGLLLGDGEYLIPEEKVTALGGGDNAKGSKVLDQMQKQIRRVKHGTDKQPGKIDLARVLPV